MVVNFCWQSKALQFVESRGKGGRGGMNIRPIFCELKQPLPRALCKKWQGRKMGAMAEAAMHLIEAQFFFLF